MRQLPDTSISAWRQAKMEFVENHKAKIIAALQSIGEGNYERISSYCGLESHAVMRRLSELEREGKVIKPGTKSATAAGRMAYNYKLKI